MSTKTIGDKLALVFLWAIGSVFLTVLLVTHCTLYATDSVGLTDSGITTNKLLSEEEQQSQQAWHDKESADRKQAELQKEQESKQAEIKTKIMALEIAIPKKKEQIKDQSFTSKLQKIKSNRRVPKLLPEMIIKDSDLPGGFGRYPGEIIDTIRLHNKKVNQAVQIRKQGGFEEDEYEIVWNTLLTTFNGLLDASIEYVQEQGPSEFNLP